MPFDIREADLSDPMHSAGIVEVLDSYASEPVGGGTPLSVDVRERLVSGLREQPTAVVFLAFNEQRPVGAAVCFWGFSTFQARPLINIHDLAVIPEFRGQGIGRALLAAVETCARRRGCCKITLEVREDNSRARKLYECVGFGDFVLKTPVPTWFLSKPLDNS